MDSSQFRRQAPHYLLSDDPDVATVQTVAEMCREIHQAANDPLVQQCAARAARQFHGGAGFGIAIFGDTSETRRQAEACWWWCKHHLKFRHHGKMFEAWSADLGDPRTKLQLLIAPDVLVRMKRMEGDCAIYTMMLAALLECLGIEWQIVTGAVDRSQPEIFSHVWVRAVLPNGAEPLDASHGSFPGWQVPSEDIYRMWIFDRNGSRVYDTGQRFGGLHAYRARRGMGDVCNQGDEDYDPAACIALSESTVSGGSCPGSPGCPGYVAPPIFSTQQAPAYTAPSQNSAQWATFATQMMKAGMTLAEINAIQPGTVVSANGAILRQNPGYSVPAGGTTSLNLGSSNTILYIGIAAAAIFALSMFKGGR